jgi:16S rRNA (guanine527-N7)-methyltransferase
VVFHVKHQGWTDFPNDLSDEQVELLERYELLLHERALPGRMIAAGDSGRLRQRHLVDSLRATDLIRAEDRSAIDMGSGAGLPGIVLAISNPDLEMTLVETRRSRAAFLTEAVADLGLERTRVFHGRIEELDAVVDLCFARAFGPIERSWEAAIPHLNARGRLLYWAGKSFRPYDALAGTSDDLRVQIASNPALASFGPVVMMSRH